MKGNLATILYRLKLFYELFVHVLLCAITHTYNYYSAQHHLNLTTGNA